MKDLENTAAGLCAIYVDVGTTNTRVWLQQGNEVLAHANKQVGVRDSAQEGTKTALLITLKELIAQVQAHANHNSTSCAPVCVMAAGMVGSSLGLAELSHIPAPAGLGELSAATSTYLFPEVTDLPFLLVPGVRSVPDLNGFRSPHQIPGQVDVMRGEETLCVGLQALGIVEAPAVILTLGSHWKAIQLAADGRIQSSVTSLSGEMIQAVQTQTILASSLSSKWPDKIDPDWLAAGIAEQRGSGLSRALFCVRLLELEGQGTPDDRFAYLLGAFVSADLDALVARGIFAHPPRVVISGHAVTTAAWALALELLDLNAVVLTAAETEASFLAGLHQILIRRIISGGIATGITKPAGALSRIELGEMENGCEAAI